jgi:hypothetical protein
MDTGVAYVPTNIGHIFGRMGVGSRTTPGNSDVVNAYQWTTPSTEHGMIVSMFPSDPSATGLAATQNIKISTSYTTFDTLSTVLKPTRPGIA